MNLSFSTEILNGILVPKVMYLAHSFMAMFFHSLSEVIEEERMCQIELLLFSSIVFFL